MCEPRAVDRDGREPIYFREGMKCEPIFTPAVTGAYTFAFAGG